MSQKTYIECPNCEGMRGRDGVSCHRCSATGKIEDTSLSGITLNKYLVFYAIVMALIVVAAVTLTPNPKYGPLQTIILFVVPGAIAAVVLYMTGYFKEDESESITTRRNLAGRKGRTVSLDPITGDKIEPTAWKPKPTRSIPEDRGKWINTFVQRFEETLGISVKRLDTDPLTPAVIRRSEYSVQYWVEFPESVLRWVEIVDDTYQASFKFCLLLPESETSPAHFAVKFYSPISHPFIAGENAIKWRSSKKHSLLSSKLDQSIADSLNNDDALIKSISLNGLEQFEVWSDPNRKCLWITGDNSFHEYGWDLDPDYEYEETVTLKSEWALYTALANTLIELLENR